MKPLESEILGDWSNLKGTEYHLVYALWALLCKGASSVAFYAGNDLLAHPIPPPSLSLMAEPDVIALRDKEEDEDIWVQLKATARPWKIHQLLGGNLLVNFICNALGSQRQGRAWRVQLVTQGWVERAEVLKFIASPNQRVRQGTRGLTDVKEEVQLRWRGAGQDRIDEVELDSVAMEVLRQLAETRPLQIETLRAEVEVQLIQAYPDLGAVRHLGNTLLGALISDAAMGPSVARAYDAAWLDRAAGQPVVLAGQFDYDPGSACNEAIREATNGWTAGSHAHRLRLEIALAHFVASPEPVFALIGASGTGKSWALASWATEGLAGRLRLLLTGDDFRRGSDLASLVAPRLRPFTTGSGSDKLLLRRVLAATAPGRGPLVMIVDDLTPPVGDEESFRRNLARLVEECRVVGAKLVVSCQRHVWELHRLGTAFATGHLFPPEEEPDHAPNAPMVKQPPSYSFLLEGFSPDEQGDALGRRLPQDRAAIAAPQLGDPAFAPLRNPYLLERYVERHGEHLGRSEAVPAPVRVDALLDNRVQDALETAAIALRREPADLETAFDTLLNHLWEMRPSGVAHARAVSELEIYLPGQGLAAIEALQHIGLITQKGGWHLTELSVAERLFAQRLGRLMSAEDNIAAGLRLADDAGVVVALLRGVLADPIIFADQLLASDRRWRGPVIDGLAQGVGHDWRTLALLSALARPDSSYVADFAACQALGQLAARDRRAYRWVAGMFLSDRPLERHRGSSALLATMDLAPRRAGAAVRLQLARIARRADLSEHDRRRHLQDALTPVLNTRHAAAARIGHRLLDRYAGLTRGRHGRHDDDFAEDLDQARGAVALGAGTSRLNELLVGLTESAVGNRRRAATALRPIAFEQPKLVRAALCEALRHEEDLENLRLLLWAAFPLVKAAPDELLTALEERVARGWENLAQATGSVLSLLGPLAEHYPERVHALLPRRLPNVIGPVARACLSEILAYAWWCCAEYLTDATDALHDLVTPDTTDLTGDAEPFRLFALRGALVARLGLRCAGSRWVAELQGRPVPFPHGKPVFFYLTLGDFVSRHAADLAKVGGSELIRSSLDCLNEKARVQVDILDRALNEARYRCADECLDVLLPLLRLQPDRLPALRELTGDWPLFRACWQLLRMGRVDPPLVAFVRSACANFTAGTAQAWDDREKCLAELMHLENDPGAALAAYRQDVSRSFGTEGAVRGLVALTDDYPERTLALLDASLQSADDLPIPFYWVEETRSWPSLLLARVHARMFDRRTIGNVEALDLCEQVLAAVASLPNSSLREEYAAVYGAIASCLSDSPPLTSSRISRSSTIGLAHDYALTILDRSARETNPAWLTEAVSDRQGWWDSNYYALGDGSLGRGSGHYAFYPFPAVRLAFVAASRSWLVSDPLALFASERHEVHMLLLRHPDSYGRPRVDLALEALNAQALRTPGDERLRLAQSELLLKLGRLAEAESTLHGCLTLPTCDDEARSVALYNLACTYARVGREEACRDALRASDALRRIDRGHLIVDDDLMAVRDKEWFRELHEA